jgi:hypothetical protein
MLGCCREVVQVCFFGRVVKLTATRSRRSASYLTSMLRESASEFLPELADFHAFLAEIRNCPGLTPMIRLKGKEKS